MTQELTDLRASILEGRYTDALGLVDELEWMSKQANLRNIESFLIRMLVHFIKNQVEQRLTNSWAASIGDSVQQIQKLNLKDNKTSYYFKSDEWQPLLEEILKTAIRTASVEVMNGTYSPFQLSELVNRDEILLTAQKFIALTYVHKSIDLPDIIDEKLTQLPGGQDWKEGRR
ncbi:DUF29 family protein [Argonema antarcticum]|uniref:DUF29 family protein n=1 Tax=Argonema antarcticum TaxID=2942763 RepID=UPI002011F628|nr:DUF29 family protein [Argonema antarcticum]MCL1469537.1 DUF29 domain-containing protein [Argonema antarcticum A004/B2]